MKLTTSVPSSSHPISSKLVAGGLCFVLLTAGIYWYQIERIQPGDTLPALKDLHWGFLLLILLFLPLETIAAATRIWVVSRVLHPSVRLWTCVKAELSNVAVSTLTPSQTGGGPAQVYILCNAGMKVGTALTISLLSFVGTMAALLIIGLVCLIFPGNYPLGTAFTTAVAAFVLVASLMAFAAACPAIIRIPLAALSRFLSKRRNSSSTLQDWWPPESKRNEPPVDRMGRLASKLVDLLYLYRDDVRSFFNYGKLKFLWVCLLSLVIFTARLILPYFCLRFLGIAGTTAGAFIQSQMALIFIVFFAPTPGSAGLGEAASMMILSDTVPAGFLPYYNLLWRSSTVYIAAVAGLLCLLQSVANNARGIFQYSNRQVKLWRE